VDAVNLPTGFVTGSAKSIWECKPCEGIGEPVVKDFVNYKLIQNPYYCDDGGSSDDWMSLMYSSDEED